MARDWQKYLSDDDRRALDTFRTEVSQPHLGGPGGDMSIAARSQERPRSPVDAIGPEEEKALAMFAEGDVFREPDLGGPQGVPTAQPGSPPRQQPDEGPPQGGGMPRNAGMQLDAPPPAPQDAGARLDAPQAPPSQQPRGAPGTSGEDAIAAAREKGGDRAQALMALSAVGQLFGGGGGAAERTEQQAFSERDRLVSLAQQKVARERSQEQQQFQRRMAEEGLDVRRQQVEGSQQAREAQARAKQMEAQREQAMRDPASDVSRRAQMAVKKTFGDAIPDEVLQQMSAEELQSSGNPVMAAAKKAQAMRLKQQQFEDRREAKLEDYQKKREMAFPYDMRIARAKAAMDQSEFEKELEARTETQRDLYEMKQQDRESRDFREDVQKYAKLATNTELPTQIGIVRKAQRLARELEDETGQIFDLKDEVLRRLAPGARSAMRGKAAELQMLVNQLKNITLKERSGAAVTRQEQERFEEELGTGFLSNEENLKRGLQNARNYLENRHQSIMGGFGPEVVQQYRRNRQAVTGAARDEEEGGGQPTPEDEPEDTQQSSAQSQQEPQNDRVVVTVITPDGQTMRRRVPRGQLETVRKRAEAAGAQVEVQ